MNEQWSPKLKLGVEKVKRIEGGRHTAFVYL